MSNYNEKRGLKPFYMGLPIEVLRRIGDTYREGLLKYDKSPWERYYQKEITSEDFLEVFNNAVEHLFNSYDEIVNGKLHEGLEDHLAHAVVNICMIMWATENGLLPNKLNVASYINETAEEKESEGLPIPETPNEINEKPEENPSKSLLKLFGLNKG